MAEDSWQPMSTAPRDGTMLDLRFVHGRSVVGHWLPGGHCIEDHQPVAAGWYYWERTYWNSVAEEYLTGWSTVTMCKEQSEDYEEPPLEDEPFIADPDEHIWHEDPAACGVRYRAFLEEGIAIAWPDGRWAIDRGEAGAYAAQGTEAEGGLEAAKSRALRVMEAMFR